MASVWNQLTLSALSPSQWRGASYLYHLVGLLQKWRQGSWLMQWGEPLGALLCSLVFILAPFSSTPQIGVWLVALAIYWTLLTLADDSKLGITPIHLIVLLFWAIAIIATAFSPARAAAIDGLVKLTLYLIMFALMARVLRSPRLTNYLLTAVLLVTLVVGSYGVRQQFGGVEQLATWNDPTSPLAAATRVYSYLGNPNLLAAYLLPAIALSIAAVFVWQGWLPKALALTIVMVNLSCLYFTQSRGGWIGMVALSVAFLLLQYFWWQDKLPPFWRRWVLPAVFGSFAVLLLLGLLFVEPLRLRVLSIFAGRGDSSNNFRLHVWSSVQEMISDRPLIGFGPGDQVFKKVYPLYMSPKYSALSAYSIYLETALEMGYIGLGCLIWLIVVTINQGVRQIKRFREHRNPQAFWLMAAIAGMVGLMAHGSFDTVWYRPQVNTLWWLMMALIASKYEFLDLKKEP